MNVLQLEFRTISNVPNIPDQDWQKDDRVYASLEAVRRHNPDITWTSEYEGIKTVKKEGGYLTLCYSLKAAPVLE